MQTEKEDPLAVEIAQNDKIVEENLEIIEEKEQNAEIPNEKNDESRVRLIESENNELIIELNLSQPEI